jgi:predicted esterase
MDVLFATPLDANASEWELDVYAPQEPGPWPVVLFAHGFGGNRKGYVELSEALAERGAVVFTFDWPALVEDIAMQNDGRGIREMTETVECAVRFAKARAPQYGGDVGRVTLGGHSYGGFIVAWVGLAGDDGAALWADFAAARGGPPQQVECVEDAGSARVDAILGLAGGYKKWHVPRYWDAEPDLMEITDPYSHIGKNRELRVRLIHGEKDETVPVDHAVELNQALVEAGYDTELTLWDGGHGVPIELAIRKILEVAGG